MATTLEHKGAAIGPLDPDNAGDLTRKLGVHNKATKLLKQHAANWPEALRNALALPRDDDRSDALDLEEVEEVLLSLKGRKAFFAEEDTLEDASVRGAARSALGRWVTVVFTLPSGRIAYGALPYDEAFAATERRYEAAKQLQRAGKIDAESFADFVAAVRDGVAADAPASGDESAKVAELEKAAADAEAAATAAKAEAAAAQEELERLRNPEPWAGYDDLNGDDVIARVKDGGAAEFGVLGLQRIRDYEESKKDRKGVLGAVSDALDAANAPE